MKNKKLQSFIERLEKSSQLAKKEFGHLHYEQLNWKPNSNSWSVGQCIDHLITSNKLYFPIFNRHIKGNVQITFWERLPVLPRIWAKLILPAVAPNPKRKVRTAPVFEPSQSDIPADIVQKFVENNKQLIPLYQQLDSKDIDELMATSPVAKFITYTLGTACQILVDHEERHLNQAKNVMQLEGFPKAK